MNCYKVLSFFFIVFFAFISCSSHFNNSDDIEIGSPLRMRRTLESESDSDSDYNTGSDEENEPVDVEHYLPVVTLNQYRSSIKVNFLLFLLLDPSDYVITAFKPALFLALIIEIFLYFRPTVDPIRPNVPNVSAQRWLLTPLSWLTEFLILLPSEKEYYFFGVDGLSQNSILYFIFFLQMIYYLCAFVP